MANLQEQGGSIFRWEEGQSPLGYTDRKSELPPFGAECKSISGVGGFGGSPITDGGDI